MKTLYLDCSMGAAGDMLASALLELLPAEQAQAFVDEANAWGIPGVTITRQRAVKCGITGTHLAVAVHGEEERSEDVHTHADAHGHSHSHEHAHEHTHEHEHDHVHAHEHANEHEHDHVHAHEHTHEHIHDHTHGHEEGHAHTHGHEHGHGYTHHHSSMQDIRHIVCGHMQLPQAVAQQVLAVYGLIAEAESHAHGVPVEQIHFHEVGTMDAVADIAMVCMLMQRLAPQQVVVSPIHVGAGQVRCAHGVLPVPAPATAYILRNAPIYGGQIEGELCTPTGAALLQHFATGFGPMPAMRVQAIGYGMGQKDFAAANCVRAMLGESQEEAGTPAEVVELACNVDDMTAEAIAFAAGQLFAAGALDVYTLPIGMKKGRPGTLLRVLCPAAERERMAGEIFRYTSTLGIRETAVQRYLLRRSVATLQTPYGPVRRKQGEGFGVARAKYEYEDLARIARERQIGLAEAAALVDEACKGE